ncbi:putative RNA-directed DNA polymerase from transposon X-element, partial [Araneus ventricosus]
EKTHFHLPPRTFHSVDLAICSPFLLPFFNLTVDNDLYNSDHFPLIITDNRHNPTNSYRPPKYVLNAANWKKFTSLANINSETIKSSSIEQALSYIVKTIIEAADSSIPKTSGKRRKQNKPWWNADCQQAYKIQRKAWGIFRRYPTTQNFINFKKSRAESRKIQRLSRRASWRKFISGITSTISSRQMWAKVKKASGVSNSNAISVLIHNGQTISSLKGKDPKNPSNYRPIALTCCLCKVLERMINRRLVHYLEANKYLHPFQSGFRKGRSTIDNLLALETDIRLSFLQRKHLVAIFFDIEKAYDRTWRYGILKDLYDLGLRGNLPIFIKNFLQLRKFRVKVESEFSDFFIQEEGVPQGSVLSVTLFILKINNILKQLPTSVRGYLYVDDLYISCTGTNMNFIQRQLQTAVNNITQWCNSNGFTISTSKTAGVHFCRKRNLHLDPEIKLYGEIIAFVNEIRFLGVIFDKKLTFLSHVKQLRKKCESALNILKVLSTTAWGADRLSMLKIYRATVLSKLEYGCTIYGSARKSVLQKLDPIHHTALRLCSGAFRTSPVKSLYVECYEPALELKRQMLSLHYYFKIQSNANHPFHDFKLRPFLLRLQDARKSFIPVFFTRVHVFLSDLNLLYLHVTPQPKTNFPPWGIPVVQFLNPFQTFIKSDTADIIYQQIFIEHRQEYNDFIAIYTDGSKSADHVSFAVVFPNTTLSFKLHSSCSVFTAEIAAVLLALEQISDFLERKFIIYTDSLSVLESLKSFYIHSHHHPLVLNVLHLLNKFASRDFNILLY